MIGLKRGHIGLTDINSLGDKLLVSLPARTSYCPEDFIIVEVLPLLLPHARELRQVQRARKLVRRGQLGLGVLQRLHQEGNVLTFQGCVDGRYCQGLWYDIEILDSKTLCFAGDQGFGVTVLLGFYQGWERTVRDFRITFFLIKKSFLELQVSSWRSVYHAAPLGSPVLHVFTLHMTH